VPQDLTTTTFTPRVGIGACFVDSCQALQGEVVPPNPVQFSGLSPQFPGVWQINVRVPLVTEPSAAAPVVVSVNSVGSGGVALNGFNTVIYVK